eukprot:scaffold35840_cov51-Attheya_sp.AAC.2
MATSLEKSLAFKYGIAEVPKQKGNERDVYGIKVVDLHSKFPTAAKGFVTLEKMYLFKTENAQSWDCIKSAI